MTTEPISWKRVTTLWAVMLLMIAPIYTIQLYFFLRIVDSFISIPLAAKIAAWALSGLIMAGTLLRRNWSRMALVGLTLMLALAAVAMIIWFFWYCLTQDGLEAIAWGVVPITMISVFCGLCWYATIEFFRYPSIRELFR